MAAINLHIGGFADDDKIGANAFVFDKGVAGDAIAPFFHIAEIIERPIPREAKFFKGSHSIDHRRRRTFLVARAESINDAILNLALEGVPLPLRGIGYTNGIDMAVVE